MNTTEIKIKIKELVQKQREVQDEMDRISGPVIDNKLEKDAVAKTAWLQKYGEYKALNKEIENLDGKLIDLEEF